VDISISNIPGYVVERLEGFLYKESPDHDDLYYTAKSLLSQIKRGREDNLSTEEEQLLASLLEAGPVE